MVDGEKKFCVIEENVYIKKKFILKVNLIFIDDLNMSLFYDVVLDDMEMSIDEWDSLVKILQDQGYEEMVINVFFIIIVMFVMKIVFYKSLVDDRLDSVVIQG